MRTPIAEYSLKAYLNITNENINENAVDVACIAELVPIYVYNNEKR